MSGPSWIAGILAAVMILAAAYSATRLAATRLAATRLRGRATEADADGLHVLMGTAMAGMLVPQLSLVPGRAWAVVFGTGAAWFGACALRTQHPGAFSWRCRYPVPHMIECIAMVYMLLSGPAAEQGSAMAMPGLGTSPGAPASFPAFAVVLALFMLGYLMWATDQLASLARAGNATAGPAVAFPDQRALVTVPAGPGAGGLAGTAGTAGLASTAGTAGTREVVRTPDQQTPAQQTPAQQAPGQQPATGQVQLAPRLAAAGTIAMIITMGYMLILML